jgi:hypothetical protein
MAGNSTKYQDATEIPKVINELSIENESVVVARQKYIVNCCIGNAHK